MSIFSLGNLFADLNPSASYKHLWTKLEKDLEDDLPRQVLKDATAIYDKALKDRNFAQLLKSWVFIIETNADLDPENFSIDVLDPLPHEGAVNTALYNAVLAMAYQTMTDTYIRDHDLETRERYSQLSDSLFLASLTDRESLYAVSALDYEPVVKKGDDSRLFRHDLLSVLARYLFDHSRLKPSQKAQVAADLADFYLARDNREAYVLLRLEYISQMRSHEDFVQVLSGQACIDQLQALMRQAEGLSVYGDVAEEYCGFLYGDAKADFCRQVLASEPKPRNAKYFKATLDDYLRPGLRLNISDNILSDRPFSVELVYDNLYEAKFAVRKFAGYSDRYERNPILTGDLVFERSYTLAVDSLNQERHAHGYSTSGRLHHDLTLPAGKYVIITNAANQQEASVVNITSLRLLVFRLPEDKVLAVVRNNETGRPVVGAVVRLQNYSGDQVVEYPCGDRGEVIFDYDRPRDRIMAFMPGTTDQTEIISTGYVSYYSDDKDVTKNVLFTDRAIYRPGQSVHVSGFRYLRSGDETFVQPSTEMTLKLFDANHREVASQKVTTNAMGSFAADFVLPEGVLPGSFHVSAQGDDVYFRVEEYKRPTFEVEARLASAVGSSFTFGDTIQVEASARTYADVPVQGAKAHYRIELAQADFWRWWDVSWQTVSESDTVTGDDGLARVPLYLAPNVLAESSDRAVQYRVTFDVTDQAGETRSDSYTFTMSRRSFALQVQAPSVLDVADAAQQVVVNAINANHEPVPVSGTYFIFKASDLEQPIHQSGFTSGQALVLPPLVAGRYVIRAEADDRGNHQVRSELTLSIFDSRKVMGATDFSSDFVHVTRATFGPGHDGEIFFSASEADALCGYLIYSNDRLVERKELVLDKQLYRLSIPYLPQYGDGVSVMFYYVRNGHLCTERRVISYEQPDKQLQLSWSTFRDHLYPGQDEEWILSIRDTQGRPVGDAELLATMYDASLDALQPHTWDFSLSFPRFVVRYPALSTNRNRSYGASIFGPRADSHYPGREYDALERFFHSRWGNTRRRAEFLDGGAVPLMMSKAMPMYEVMSVEDDAEAPRMRSSMAAQSVNALAEEADVEIAAAVPNPETKVDLRSNFAETAFFYPHLRTDAQGQVHISFTLPESLTRWRFMGLAHDRQVRYGSIAGETVAQKDFMVQPNLPRFVREGDRASVAARVINQGSNALHAHVRMRLLDAATESEVYVTEQPIIVPAGQTSSVTFSYDVTDLYPMLICEVVGIADLPIDGHVASDGERRFLPVLSSSKYITEAVPFYVMSTDSLKLIDVHELFNHGSSTATHRRLVFEFTQHPEWTVIEALDGIKLPSYDNAPAFAASLYANTMASRLAQSIPGFEEALLAAQEAGVKAEGTLALNADLHEILLQESPWVLDALNEAEQRARLLDLFDPLKVAERTHKAFSRLQRLQQPNGSWSWFEGMEGNYYITLSTCESLIGLCQYDANVDAMVRRALAFLDEREYKAYLERKKDKLAMTVDDSSLGYLYVCSMMPDRPVSRDILKMRKEMLDKLGRSVRDLTIFGRSQAACILRSFGRVREADKFLQSVVEYTVTQPGMGRYYATDLAYYSWRDYRIPTQLAAMRALRASSLAEREELIREMQIWLLRQKQAQTWDNPMNTIGAVDFMLSTQLVDDAVTAVSLPRFTLDDKALSVSVDTTRFLAEQLGYVRTELPVADIPADGLHTFTVTPAAAADAAGSQPLRIAWGALYAQYMERLENLRRQTSGELSVDVRLLDADGRIIDPAVTSLHVGDRVTMRLVVRADRDMDFVQVRLQRPACFEPVSQRSGYCWMGGRGGYVALHDASTDVFFDRFTRGTTTFDLTFNVDRIGQYLTGVATVQCAYAPEFCAHSGASRVTVE